MDYFFCFLPLLFVVLFSCHAFLTPIIRKHIPKATRNGENGRGISLPLGRTGWTVIGETLHYLSEIQSGTLENFVTDRMNKYSSKVFKTSLIGQPMAILCGPEGNKFLFSNEKKLVQVWFPGWSNKIFPKSHNISNNEDFINIRRMLPLFLKADSLQKYVGIMDLVMKQHLQKNWDGDHVQVCPVVRKYTLALACRLFISIDDPREVEKLAKPIEDIVAGIFSGFPINLPGTALNRAIKASKEIRVSIESIVRQRKVDLMEKIVSPVQDILSHMLLTVDGSGQHLKTVDISSHLLGLIFGGYGTLNGTLTFVIKYLAELPHVYDEVLKEQMAVTSSNKRPDNLLGWEDLRKMKYSWNVASEVLRLTPPGVGAFREALTDFTYAGYKVPKGWKLHWTAHVSHMNPDYFPNPDKFDPSRFQGNQLAPYTYVPFGGGPRMCPGNEDALLAILVFIHNGVTTFRWAKVIPNEGVFNDPLPRPAHGLPIRLHRHDFAVSESIF
ncbi:hypothetical protein RJ640_003862 [Escallonia rubra]|uniref:Cytochrome P450 n=1 Tax=Escallonia rubra TaxID=112253 RepID=A0AA88U8C8_9ASTE|nr:hypothetical protein RJ640_003862 [Escallonia rubra]